QHVAAQLGLPGPCPACPAVGGLRPIKISKLPSVPAINTDLDHADRRPARPGPTFNRHRTRPHDPPARHEVGESRRHEQGSWLDPGQRNTRVISRVTQLVRTHLEPVELLAYDGDL